MNAIAVLDVTKALGAGAAVLRGVTLRVPAMVCRGLSGPTGAGKTTLLRLIAGLDRPDRGEICLLGQPVSGPRAFVPPMRRRIGFVFQTLGLWPHLSVSGHLEYVLAATRVPSGERARRRDELLDAFRLRGLERRRPAELSGGEKHLLALARALAGDVSFLLLDEPFAGLDEKLKEQVAEALSRLMAARSLTAILASHDSSDLGRLCQGVAYLREGQVVEARGKV